MRILCLVLMVMLITARGYAELRCYVCEDCDDPYKLDGKSLKECNKVLPAPVENKPEDGKPEKPEKPELPAKPELPEEPPGEKPPVDKPPGDKPEIPPGDKPPVDKPPMDKPPVDKPPVDKQPVDKLPVKGPDPSDGLPELPGEPGKPNTATPQKPPVPVPNPSDLDGGGLPDLRSAKLFSLRFNSNATARANSDQKRKYACYILEKDNGKNGRKVHRGCTVMVDESKEKTCKALDGDAKKCDLCTDDKCNSGSNVMISVTLILLSLISVKSIQNIVF